METRAQYLQMLTTITAALIGKGIMIQGDAQYTVDHAAAYVQAIINTADIEDWHDNAVATN